MPLTKSDVHYDKILTNVSIAYQQDLRDYIWRDLSPIIPVQKESDKYYVYDKGPWFRDDAKIIAPGDPTPYTDFTLSKSSYSCEEFGVGTKLPDRIRKNADNVLQLRSDYAKLVTQKVHLKMERQLASEIWKTGVWGTDNTTATDWDDYSSSTPLTDVQTAIDTVRLATGKKPNTLAVGSEVWSALMFHPDLTDLIKYTQKGIVTTDLLAQVWNLDKVLVGEAVYNSAAEGQSDSMARIWGDNALVAYIAPTPGLLQPSAMYTFMSQDLKVRRWYNNDLESEIIKASIIADFVVTGAGLGYFFYDLT